MMLACHCGAPAEWSCTRSARRYVRVRVEELQTGDAICRWSESGPRKGTYAIVDAINVIGHLGRLRLTFTIYREGKQPSVRTYDCEPESVIRAQRTDICGAAVCENCAQDPGEPHKYCPEHWLIRMFEVAA